MNFPHESFSCPDVICLYMNNYTYVTLFTFSVSSTLVLAELGSHDLISEEAAGRHHPVRDPQIHQTFPAADLHQQRRRGPQISAQQTHSGGRGVHDHSLAPTHDQSCDLSSNTQKKVSTRETKRSDLIYKDDAGR